MTTEIMQRADQLMAATYQRFPVAFEKGRGCKLWDTAGRSYTDFVAGIAVCNLGHAHPRIREAVCRQAETLLHVSNLYYTLPQVDLAAWLVEHSFAERVFFGNSGAEANEAAIKLARMYGHKKGIANPAIVVTQGSFHGRTLATLTATGNRKVQAGFEPLVQGFVRAPYDDIDALQVIAANSPNVVAILVEPVQGEGGINIPASDYLNKIRELCDQHGWLMMLDEIQTGMCRSGKWFAYQHNDIEPDVLTLAKGLGNGVPIGACLARGVAAQALKPGSHGSTFGGSPLACGAALAVIDTMQEEGLVDRAREQGERLRARLEDALHGLNCVREVRGKGLMIGIELDRPCAELVGRALDKRLLMNVTADKVIRLLPPLIIDDGEIDTIVGIVRELITEWNAGD